MLCSTLPTIHKKALVFQMGEGVPIALFLPADAHASNLNFRVCLLDLKSNSGLGFHTRVRAQNLGPFSTLFR